MHQNYNPVKKLFLSNFISNFLVEVLDCVVLFQRVQFCEDGFVFLQLEDGNKLLLLLASAAGFLLDFTG